jgi:hypothetical protein
MKGRKHRFLAPLRMNLKEMMIFYIIQGMDLTLPEFIHSEKATKYMNFK